ncbi:MAG: NADH-quinone oxidoreductase subunit NuoB [Terriglobia bacterium]|jgi:Ni,Fe-hydrogenase III small subunit|nr:NADH-quinone oxidoreductase subunit NuoB [Terriglobia bacterium]
MIFDVVKRSLQSPNVLIPVEHLLGDCRGSRLPDVHAAMLTNAIAERVVAACPTSALSYRDRKLSLNYGDCIGCGRCIEAGEGALCAAEKLTCCGVSKQGLVRTWNIEDGVELLADEAVLTAAAAEIRSIVGRALNIREVDAGSCNGCEGEIIALTNPYYDLERFGIHFVASPKHADLLLVTGPVTKNMSEAVRQTYEATPSPKLVVAVGACGCTGGIFAGSDSVVGGVEKVIPVDAYIPGCPPTPAMLLSGILQALRHGS